MGETRISGLTNDSFAGFLPVPFPEPYPTDQNHDCIARLQNRRKLGFGIDSNLFFTRKRTKERRWLSGYRMLVTTR